LFWGPVVPIFPLLLPLSLLDILGQAGGAADAVLIHFYVSFVPQTSQPQCPYTRQLQLKEHMKWTHPRGNMWLQCLGGHAIYCDNHGLETHLDVRSTRIADLESIYKKGMIPGMPGCNNHRVRIHHLSKLSSIVHL
jgi:hypothetical protein